MARVYCVKADSESRKKVGTSPNFNSGQSYERQFTEAAKEVTIEDEAVSHLWLSYQRMEKFKDIIASTPNSEENVSMRYIFYGLSNIVFPFISVCVLALIPMHDSILYPRYWYEHILLVPVVTTTLIPIYIILNCSFLMNIKMIVKKKTFVILWLAGISALFTVVPSAYIPWFWYGYSGPFPFGGLIQGYITIICMYVSLYYCFPNKWRAEKNFRKRFTFFIVAISLTNLLTLQFNFIAKCLLLIRKDYQWIIALTLPLFRELNTWILVKLTTKASSGDIESVLITCTHIISTRYSLFIAVTLGSTATPASEWVILVSKTSI